MPAAREGVTKYLVTTKLLLDSHVGTPSGMDNSRRTGRIDSVSLAGRYSAPLRSC